MRSTYQNPEARKDPEPEVSHARRASRPGARGFVGFCERTRPCALLRRRLRADGQFVTRNDVDASRNQKVRIFNRDFPWVLLQN
jgi:hypothetical protein